MTPYLEAVPSDVLQHIAYFTSSDFVLEPPRNLLALMLTSSYLYNGLNVHASPHLYARLFRTRFDFSNACCPWRTGLPDSIMARHFTQRFRALRRAKKRNMSNVLLREDLWAVLWMAMENNGLNEEYLSSVNFATYAIEIAKLYLNCHADACLLQHDPLIQSLVVCILCYVTTREKLMKTPRETREELLNLLRPLAYPNIEMLPSKCNYYSKRRDEHKYNGDVQSSPYALIEEPANHMPQERFLEVPASEAPFSRPLSSAIILTFAIKEIVPLVIPSHLPQTRAAALVANRSGPTLVDVEATLQCKTPLFADIRPEFDLGTYTPGIPNARLHDPEFCMLARSNSETFAYLPGTLSGVWEGSYLVLSRNSSSVNGIADFACRKPMQCAITEFLCYPPHKPLPLAAKGIFDIPPRNIFVKEDGVEICSRNYCYEKYASARNIKFQAQQDTMEALDVLLLGETLEDHDQAWGGYRFAGRVGRDGRVFIKREPKNTEDDPLGTWYFVGYVRYGSAFVGQWMSSSSHDRVQGIFSMHKTRDTWKR